MRDTNAETKCAKPFHFDQDNEKDMQKPKLRELLWNEIRGYHPKLKPWWGPTDSSKTSSSNSSSSSSSESNSSSSSSTSMDGHSKVRGDLTKLKPT